MNQNKIDLVMENFVPFEIAKKLKEKGFNEPCINAVNRFKCTYRNGWLEYLDDREDEYITQKDLKNDGDCLLPLIHQVLKWLREEKKISIEIGIHCSLKWMCSIYEFSDGIADFTQYNNNGIDDTVYILYETYELAALAGIEYVIDNLI